jgi:hypothetical protein
MTLAVFDAATAGYLAIDVNYRTEDDLPTVVQRAAGDGTEIRAALQSIARRSFTVKIRAKKDERQDVDEFWRTKNYQVTAVLFSDPSLSTRTGVALGAASSNQTTFTLPTSGENSRDYPQSGISSATVYDDGGALTTSTIGVDARSITTTVAPASDSTMTADYSFYRLVRLVGTYEWSALAPNFFETTIELLEVPA